MKYKKIEKYLNENLKPKRVKHTHGVAIAAVELAKLYGENENDAELAALLHDCGKYLSDEKLIEYAKNYGYEIDEVLLNQPQLLHGIAGAYIAENTFGITEKRILDAIQYHTIPRIEMTLLDKIIFVADIVEEGRDYDGVEEIRQIAYKNLDEAYLLTLNRTIQYVVERGILLHTDSVNAYNYMLIKLNKYDKINS